MEKMGIDCQVGHPAKIRGAEPRRQKHDRRDADLILKPLMENNPAALETACRSASSATAPSSIGRNADADADGLQAMALATVYDRVLRCAAKRDQHDSLITARAP
jgi:hypothetical protein